MESGLRQHIEEYCKSKGWGVTDGDIIETITGSKAVWVGVSDNHRWYSITPTVVEINGRFVQYDDCAPDGDNSVEDCIGERTLDDFVEVYPKQVTTTVYSTER